MHWYLQVLKKYADFSGRARRKEFWLFLLVNVLIRIVLSVPYLLAMDEGLQLLFSIITNFYSLALFLPWLAVSVRRLHDTDHSGWWYFQGLVPFVGLFLLLFWLSKDGDAGPNQYGPDPKQDPVNEPVSAFDEAPQTAMQKKARWFLPLAVIAVAAVTTGGWVYWLDRGTAEARILAPCTRVDASAEQVLNLDLAALGLQVSGKQDAASVYSEGFDDGAMVEYSANGQPAALVAVLRYSTSSDAAGFFDGFADWAEGSCGRWSSASFGSKGVLHCDFSDGHDMILRSDNWILDIETVAVNGVPAPELADQIRDAIATHWQGLSSGS